MFVARVGVALVGVSAIASAQVENAKHNEFFETRVRPVLANKCYACHADNKLGGLRVDSRAGLLEGGKTMSKATSSSLCWRKPVFQNMSFNPN